MSEFAIAFSESLDEKEAIREISLHTKRFLPRQIDFVLLFFTSHYRLPFLASLIVDMLNPKYLGCVNTPLLIYEGKVFPRGIVTLSGVFPGAKIYFNTLTTQTREDIEVGLRKLVKNVPKFSFISTFLSGRINLDDFLIGLKLGLGKRERFLGAGFLDQERRVFQVINKKINEGVVLLGWDKEVLGEHKKIGGFVSLGKSFIFTKVDFERRIILEIDNHPAFEIYKKYLREKIDIFKERKMFYLYPLGVKREEGYRLISIKKVLEDGSLLFLGKVKEGERGNIMILKEEVLFEKIEEELKNVSPPKVVFLVESLLREKILKEKIKEELQFLKKKFSSASLVGFYVDYCIDFDVYFKEYTVEEGKFHLVLFK